MRWRPAARAVGAWFTAVSLVTGMLWGKPMWGTYWAWDPRLTAQLILLFLFLGYMGLRAAHRRHRARRPGQRGAGHRRRRQRADHPVLGGVVELAPPGAVGHEAGARRRCRWTCWCRCCVMLGLHAVFRRGDAGARCGPRSCAANAAPRWVREALRGRHERIPRHGRLRRLRLAGLRADVRRRVRSTSCSRAARCGGARPRRGAASPCRRRPHDPSSPSHRAGGRHPRGRVASPACSRCRPSRTT